MFYGSQRTAMRAANTRPSVREVAHAIAEVLDLGASDMPAVEKTIHSLDEIAKTVATTWKIKNDFAELRRHVEELREKYMAVPYLATFLDGIIGRLDLDKVSGPDPHFDMLKLICARMAKAAIDNSPDKRLGDRLRRLAGYFYWYATGNPDEDLEPACRQVTAEVAAQKTS